MSRQLHPNAQLDEMNSTRGGTEVAFPHPTRTSDTLVFVPTYWPDFDRTALENAIIEYRRRERRFGGLIARTGS